MIDKKMEVTNLITPLINSLKTLNAEWDNLVELGLGNYLVDQTEKYYFTNTFIHRGDKVEFYSIYHPIKANYKKHTTDFDELESLFQEHKNITIIGSAGSGKTTLVKHIFLRSVSSKFKIPIIIELRFLNDYDGDFEKLLIEKNLKLRIKPSEDILRRSLKTGKFLFLLDGYDEIFSSKKQELNRQIELFVDSYPKNTFVITTRPSSGIERFSRFHDFKVQPLTDWDVEKFINKIVDSTERRQRILKIIKDQGSSNYLEYLRNPLLLSMFILAFESHPEIPSRKSSFYRNVFDTLYSKHDGITKNSFPREKLTKLEREDFENILSVFSYMSLIQGRYTFTCEYLTDTLKKVIEYLNIKCNIEHLIYDLQTSISIIIQDGFEYNFPHRSMQEYFAALFISNLPSEKKSRAYENSLESLVNSGTDLSFNLWSICKELDDLAFTEYFLIPQLKIYNDKISGNNIKLLDSYLKTINGSLMYNNWDINLKEKQFIIFRMVNFYGALVQFTNVYEYRKFAQFTLNKKVHQELLAYVESNAKLKDLNELGLNRDVKNMLIRHGILDVINSFKLSITEKIEQLEKRIRQTSNKMDNLLGP